MYLCMCTPDLYFRSAEVLISLQNKSTKIHSTNEQLLFPSTNACSGGLHGWAGHRHWATLTSSQHSPQREMQAAGYISSGCWQKHKSIDQAWLFHPALHTCSWGAFLLGFWSTICLLLLLVTRDAAKQKKNWGLQCSPLLQLPPGWTFQDAICLEKVALAEGTGRRAQAAGTPDGHTQFLAHFLCSGRDALSAGHSWDCTPQTPTASPRWRWLSHPWCSSTVLAQDVHPILSIHFTEVSGGFRSKTLHPKQLQVVC